MESVDQPSPRYYSDGSYGTRTNISSVPISPLSARSVSSEGDLSSSSTYLARLRVKSFLIGLPSRSWLGKHIADCATIQNGVSKTVIEFTGSLWLSLIKCEDYQRQILYQSITVSPLVPDSDQYLRVFASCWKKCGQILEDTAAAMIQNNPAYLRTQTFTPEKFIEMVIINSLVVNSSCRRWVRLSNLLQFTVHRISEEVIPCPRSSKS